MTSNLESLVLGASISTVYRKFVVENPDVKSKIAEIQEMFRRYGHKPRWSVAPNCAVASHNGAPNPRPSLILEKASSQSPDNEDHRAVAELNKCVEIINEFAALHAVELIGRLQRGEWMAHGIMEPPDHGLERKFIHRDWWNRTDGLINFTNGEYSRRVPADPPFGDTSRSAGRFMGWKFLKQFSMIIAFDVFPERRVKPDSNLLGVVDALADPTDRDCLRRARATSDKAFEDLDRRLREEFLTLLRHDRLRLSRRDRTSSAPNWVKRDTLVFAEFNFEDSTMTSPGIKSVEVRAHPVETMNPKTISLDRDFRRHELKKQGVPGPRPRAEEIISAFEYLLDDGAINPSGTKTSIYELIRQEVIDKSDNKSGRGLSNSTIDTYIAARLNKAITESQN